MTSYGRWGGGWASGGPSDRQVSYASTLQDHDSLFHSYENLVKVPNPQDGLTRLRKIASLVKPIMRKRGWKIQVLSEFLPDDQRLLGLNINQTYKICVRLRYTHNPGTLLPMEQTVDTMLHELSHIVWGDHDANFHALWDELRGEYETLVSKGYTGEGFLSRGQKLGGGRVPPPDELRRLARASAEKRRTLTTGSGRKLGGAPLHRGTDPRKVIADAATRRNTINRGCASGTAEAGELAEQAGRNTFKTKADEDDANDRAIAEALLELMEEEENRKLNGTYATPPPSGGLGWTPETGLFSAGEAKEQAGAPMSEEEQMKWALQESMEGVRSHVPPALSLPSAKSAPPIPIQTKSIPLASPAAQSRSRPQMNSRPVSRLVAEAEAKKAGKKRPLSTDLTLKTNGSHDSAPNNNYALPSKPLQPSRNATAPDLIDLTSSSPPSSPIATSPSVSRHPSPPADPNSWTCTICTCINPLQFLSCDACGIDRPSFVSRNMARRAGNVANSNGTLNGGGTGKGSGLGWNCDRCGTFMEHKWWTCSRCGLVKRSS